MAQHPKRGGPPSGKRDGSPSPYGGDGKPQTKRRRLDKPEPDESGDWDELEFTQQDLENLDIIASQAIEGGASTSRQGAESGPVDTQQTQDLGSTSVSAQYERSGIFQAPAPGATLRLKNRSSTSGSDSSVYPQSSASLRRTSSSEVSTAAGSLTPARSSNDRSSEEPAGAEGRSAVPGPSVQNGAPSSIVTITALREDLRKKDIEAQKAQSELYAKDGEVKFLKEALHKQEQELERLRAERDERKDAEEQRQKEREKEMKQKVERLQTEVEFKAQDLLQLQQRCRTLESKLTLQQSSVSSEPQPSTSTGGGGQSQAAQSPGKSSKVRTVELRALRTPEKGTFPSYQSFMSPRAATGGANHVGTMTTEERQESTQLVETVKDGRPRRLRLAVPRFKGTMTDDSWSDLEIDEETCLLLDQHEPASSHGTSQGKTHGPQLVSQLLQCSLNSAAELEDSGIVGLLQRMPLRHDLMGLKYERDDATARLSPVRKGRQAPSPGTQASKHSPSVSPKPIVQREHFLQALQGLRQLIDAPPPSDQPPSSKPEQPSLLPHAARGAVLLLPMVNDYLQHYMDILSNSEAAPSSPNVSSSSNKSSSCEAGSSLESLTSSLGVLMQQGAEYANTVETLMLCTLRVLNTLVSVCEDVRSVLVSSRVGVPSPHPAPDASTSSIETDQEKEKPSESGMEGDDERSTTSSDGSSFFVSPLEILSSPALRLDGLNMLQKLVRLATPSQESSGFKVPVVEAALDILSSLAVKLPDSDVDRLHVVVVRGVLTACLKLEHQPGITGRALDLFSTLVRSRPVLPSLCTKAGMSDSCSSCTLLNVYVMLTRLLATCRGKQQMQPLLLRTISKVMGCVAAVVSFHRNGVDVLTDNNCRCSGQIIPSLVHSMFYLLRDYQLSHSTDVFVVLRKGVLLLHELSLRDPNFQQRYGVVLPYYSTLVSGLTRVYKDRDDVPPVEASALEELWEELDESDAGSQDSDHEEPMATDS